MQQIPLKPDGECLYIHPGFSMLISNGVQANITKRWDENYRILVFTSTKRMKYNLHKKVELFSIDQKDKKIRVIATAARKLKLYLERKRIEYCKKCDTEILNLETNPRREYKRTTPTHNQLLDKLLKLLQLFVRLRDTNEYGRGVCISCGKKVHYKHAHGGHFISRVFKSICCSLFNINLQCSDCNSITGTQKDTSEAKVIDKNYRKNLIDKHGYDIVRDLEEMKIKETRDPGKYGSVNVGFIKEEIAYYTPLVKKMLSAKLPSV